MDGARTARGTVGVGGRTARLVGSSALAAALAAAGCGGVEGDLLDALQAKEERALCVSPQLLGVDAFEANDGKRYVAKAGDFSFMDMGSAVQALDALREEGFVREQATSLPRGFASPLDAWEITPKGAEFFRPDPFGAGIEVWIGEKKATEIVEYTEPGSEGAIQASFRYEVTLNDLADDLDIEEALEREVARLWPGEGEAMFVKTNKGWRLQGAMWQ